MDEKSFELIEDIARTIGLMGYDFSARVIIALYISRAELPMETVSERVYAITQARQYIDKVIEVEFNGQEETIN